MTIAGVPEKISRTDYTRLIESVELKADNLQELVFGWNSVTATVIAHNAEGKPYVETTTGEIAVHSITIPVEG